MTLKMNGKTIKEISLEAIDAVDSAKKTLRARKEIELPEAKDFSAEDIKALREREGMSQGLFAAALLVSKETVIAWEHEKSTPRPSTRLLLSIIEAQGIKKISLSLKTL